MPGNLSPEERVQLILARTRPMLPSILQRALDQYIDLAHITEVSIDRFIEFADSLRYRPPAGIGELLERLRLATREIETVSGAGTVTPALDPTLPTYEENERHVRPRVSNGHWRQRPVNQMTVDPDGEAAMF